MEVDEYTDEFKLTELVLGDNFFWKDILDLKDKVDGEQVTLKEFNGYITFFKNFLNSIQPWISSKDLDLQGSYRLIIKSGILLKKPVDFDKVFTRLFKKSFDAFKIVSNVSFDETLNSTSCTTIDENDKEQDRCSCCIETKEDCKCKIILENFTQLNKFIEELDLIENLSNPAIVDVVYKELTNYLETKVKGEFFKPRLDNVFEWMNNGLLPWLEFATAHYSKANDYMDDDEEEEEEEDYYDDTCLTVEQWKPRLNYFVYKAFAELRISELFSIIVDYPDSLPAINDLKECMLETESRQHLTDSLKESFENRLLNPSVNTDDILTQYVSAIRTLRELDPAGVILENVCTPLRQYLRGRDDTIKCIITCLTDQETSPGLAEELLGTTDDDRNPNEAEESDGEDWVPDPIDAKTDLSSKEQRTADIINILVNIYGSQDMFVSQYRVLLADRILTNFSFDITNERRYLELLKRRFGENHLHFCDIMLKDIQDSYRINRLVKDELEKEKGEKKKELDDTIEFNSFVISATFWPSLSDDKVEPPAIVERTMDQYTDVFKRLKGGNRTLNWYTSIGSVEIEVELDDCSKTFYVTPAQATLLLKFQEKDEWTLQDISQELNASKTSMRSRIAYWIGQGVIIEKENDVFISASTFNNQGTDVSIYESDEDDSATSSQNAKDEELQVYWSYVTGMLTNLSALPLERIYAMLKMFAMAEDSSAQCSIDDVKKFLQSKVHDGELLYVDGMYRMPPKSS